MRRVGSARYPAIRESARGFSRRHFARSDSSGLPVGRFGTVEANPA